MKKINLFLILLFTTVALGLVLSACSSKKGENDTDDTTEPKLIVAPLELAAFGHEDETTRKVTVQTNQGEWDTSCTENWVIIEHGDSGSTFTVGVLINDTGETRSAVITVSAGELSKEVSLTQTAP